MEQNFEVATNVVGAYNTFHGFLREINVNEAREDSRVQSDEYCRKVVLEHSLNPVEIRCECYVTFFMTIFSHILRSSSSTQ